MTTELVLLLSIYVFIFAGIISKDTGPLATFKKSTPKLAARIERNLTIGNKLTMQGQANQWKEE